jgi:TonB family protein
MLRTIKSYLHIHRRQARMSLYLMAPGVLVGCAYSGPVLQMDRGDGLGAESFAIRQELPSCPAASLRRKLDGLVVVAIDVNSKGAVTRATILTSPDKIFEPGALRSATAATFRMHDGMPGTGRLFYYYRCSQYPFKPLTPSDLVGQRR